MSLRQRTVKAVWWTAISAGLRGAIALGQLAVLARLLTPTQFGLVAATAAIIAVGSLFSDLGLNSAYLQARSVTDRERSALYWVNVLCGALLTVLLCAGTFLVEVFVPVGDIGQLLKVYSLIFVIAAIGLQLRFDAEKRLEFKRLAAIEISATTTGACVAITFAALGYGAISMVYGALTAAALNTTLSWIFLAAGWRPSLRARLRHAKRFLSFGLATVGNGILNQFSTNLDMLFGAYLLGAREFGLYAAPRNLFSQLLSLINPIITRVGFPLIAHLDNDRRRIAGIYTRMLRAVVGVNAPFYIFAAFFAEQLVMIVFGERWATAVDVFAILALWGLSRCVMNPLGNLLFGMGKPGWALRWNLVQMVIAALVLPFAFGGDSLDLAVVMLALMAAQILPAWYFMVRPLCGIPLRIYITVISVPLIASLVVIGGAAAAVYSVENGIVKVIAGAALVGPVYLLISYLLKEEWLILALQQLKLDPAAWAKR